MKQNNKWYRILVGCLLIFLIGMVAFPQGSKSEAAGTSTVKSVTITYPEGQTSATAFVDTLSLHFTLDVPKMAEGEQTHITFGQPNSLGYNRASFNIGGSFQVTPDATGFTLTALQNTTPQLVQVAIPANYTANVSGTETIPLSIELNGQTTSVNMTIKEYKDTVDKSELVKKIPLGFTADGNLEWVAYYNYNQLAVSGSADYPFIFQDTVGANQVLVKDSISAYKVSEPIAADGSRNLTHDSYDFDMSNFLQKEATNTGWNYENPSFKGFPSLTGGTLPSTASYYIVYETKVTDDGTSLYTNELYTQGVINGNGSEPIRIQDRSPAQFQAAGQGSGDSDNLVGSLVFEKADSADTSIKLAGATFTLTDPTTQEVFATITTDETGTGSLGDIPYGSYVLQETKAPEGYQLSDKTYPVTISEDQQKVDLGTISNDKTPPPVEPKGSLTFEKVDSADPTIKLADATFQLTNQATQEVFATITTDEAGLGSLNDIPAGEYTLQETKAPEGYQLSDKTFPVTISTDQQKIDLGTISNEKTPPPVEPKGSLTFEKVDSADATIKLAGATFQLINQATQEVYATITTDKTGLGSLNDIPAGEYTLKETKAPEGYQLADKTYPVTISEDQQTVDLKNIPNTKVPSNPVTPVEPTTPDQPEKPNKPITPSCPIIPSVPSTPSASTPITPVDVAGKPTRIVSEVTPSAPVQTLPTTGDTSNDTLPLFGGLLILSTGGYFLIRRKG